jgi:hypothetical protein
MPRCARCDLFYEADYDGCPHCARQDSATVMPPTFNGTRNLVASAKSPSRPGFRIALAVGALLIGGFLGLLFGEAEGGQRAFDAGRQQGIEAGIKQGTKSAQDSQAVVAKYTRDHLVSSLGWDLNLGDYYIVKFKEAASSPAFKLEIDSLSQPLQEGRKYEARSDGVWSYGQ